MLVTIISTAAEERWSGCVQGQLKTFWCWCWDPLRCRCCPSLLPSYTYGTRLIRFVVPLSLWKCWQRILLHLGTLLLFFILVLLVGTCCLVPLLVQTHNHMYADMKELCGLHFPIKWTTNRNKRELWGKISNPWRLMCGHFGPAVLKTD